MEPAASIPVGWPWLRIGAAAAAVASAVPLQGATILDPADAPDVAAHQYEALAASFPSVGEVDGDGPYDGSGVLIGQRWVLTAGHITALASSATFHIAGASYQSSRIFSHPGYSVSSGSSLNDLGVLELASPVRDVQPAAMWGFQDPADVLGRELVWAGHGFTGTGRTGQIPMFAWRAFTNVADFIGASGLPDTSFIADFDHPDGSENAPGSPNQFPTQLEGSLAPGDSGGGAFMAVDGRHFLVGINAFGAALDGDSDADYGDLSGATHLGLFHGWIAEVTGVTPVPEPTATAWLLLSLTLFLLFRGNPLR